MGCKTIGRFTFDSATVADLAEDGLIEFTNKTSSNDCVSCDGTNISLRAPGVYLVLFNATFVATAAGAIESQGYRNGSAMPGMHAISTAAAVGDNVSQAYAQPVTVGRNTGEVTLNFRVPQATSERIASVTVIKEA